MPPAAAPVTNDNPHLALSRLVVLRWFMLLGALVVLAATPVLLGIALPWPPMLAVLALLAGFNLLSARRLAEPTVSERSLCVQQIVDVVALGVLLFLSGGAANPLVSLLLLPVATAALTLPARGAAVVAGLAIVAYSLLSVWYVPLPIGDAERAARLHLAGMWLTFVVSVLLIAWLIVRMNTSVRERDAALAQAREQALRDERVVALGALAAGAAHELGTPLATMAVIVGEHAGDAGLPAEVREDMALLREQIAACKSIVSGLAQRAGAARSDAARPLPADAWIGALLARWRATRPAATCRLELVGPPPAPEIVAEATIDQAVGNLLNNAADADPGEIAARLEWNGDSLVFSVRDGGSGFPTAILAGSAHAPADSTTGGAGIGLLLTRAAVERCGGRLELGNPAGGGAEARIVLPLTRIIKTP